MVNSKSLVLSNGLAVKKTAETKIVSTNSPNGVFSDFSLPSLIYPVVSHEKRSILAMLCSSLELGSVVQKLKTKNLTLIIPAEFRDAVNNGTAYLGKSSLHPGGMTPNIYDDSGRIIGQGFVQEGMNVNAFGDVLNNVAVFAMLQTIVGKLDDLQKDVSLIKEGQKDDRLGKIIGSFKSYVVALPTFRTEEEKRNASFLVYCSISEGLYQMHFFLDRLCQNLQDSPENWWKHVLQAIKHPLKNVAAEKEAVYNELVTNLYNFYNLLMLSDVVLLHRGASYSVLEENHKSIKAFYNRALDSVMEEKVHYLTGGNMDAFLNIKNLTTDSESQLKKVFAYLDKPDNPLEISFEQNEIDYYLEYGR